MAEKKILLRVITPTEIKFDDQADMVVMRCTTGDLGVLPGHEARTAVLDFGVLRIYSGTADIRVMAVYGGLAEIKKDVVTILANDAEWPHDIDAQSAREDRERIARRLREHEYTGELDMQRDQVMLRRALVQIEAVSYQLDSK